VAAAGMGGGGGRGGMVLRQMAVGQPIGFHSTDNPPLAVVSAQAAAAASVTNISVDVWIEVVDVADKAARVAGAVVAVGVSDAQCGHCGVYFQLGADGAWSIGNSPEPTPALDDGGSAVGNSSATHGAAESWASGVRHSFINPNPVPNPIPNPNPKASGARHSFIEPRFSFCSRIYLDPRHVAGLGLGLGSGSGSGCASMHVVQ
jgi:hypothetical protein